MSLNPEGLVLSAVLGCSEPRLGQGVCQQSLGEACRGGWGLRDHSLSPALEGWGQLGHHDRGGAQGKGWGVSCTAAAGGGPSSGPPCPPHHLCEQMEHPRPLLMDGWLRVQPRLDD